MGFNNKKWSWDDVCDLLGLLGSLCLAKKTSPHICVYKKNLLGQKNMEGSMNFLSEWGKRFERTFVAISSVISLFNLLGKDKFLPSMVAELGWAGS